MMAIDQRDSLRRAIARAMLLPRIHWVAILYGQIQADLALTGGVHNAAEVLKAMMAGARVAMMASALFIHGIEHLAGVCAEVVGWMGAHEYALIRQMLGGCWDHAK
jgi:dihydroorotate dehydrogenase (fumarate)